MKFLRLLLVVTVLAFMCTDCRYSFLVPDEDSGQEPVDPTDPDAPQISFSEEIEPIFNNSDKCTTCHTTGKQRPDLSTGNAYKSINSTRYINDSNPSESLIYKHPHPDTGTHSQKKYTNAEADLILAWIIQGAKNN